MSHDLISRRTLLVAGSTAFLAACAGQTTTPGTQGDKKLSARGESFNDGWMLQSSEVAQSAGEALSMPSADVHGWYKVTLPSTVLAALVANGEYPDLFVGDNLKKVPKSRFIRGGTPTRPATTSPTSS